MILTVEMRLDLGLRKPKDPRARFEEIEAAMIMCRYEGIQDENHYFDLWVQIRDENWREKIAQKHG